MNKKSIPAEDEIKSILLDLENHDMFASEEEREDFLNGSLSRYKKYLELIPKIKGAKVLDIGIRPYFFSYLLQTVLNYEVIGIERPIEKFPGDSRGDIKNTSFKNILSHYCNVEKELMPFDDNTFDIIIFTDVIEHLLQSPSYALSEIRRVLKKDGFLFLGTPNAAFFLNRYKLFCGKNIYDKYSGYGPYGRHNREYTVSELCSLVTESGFQVVKLDTPSYGKNFVHKIVIKLHHAISKNLSMSIILIAKPEKNRNVTYPKWLYRSY